MKGAISTHIVMAQSSHLSKPHITAPTITVVSDIVSYEAIILLAASNVDYNFDRIVEATESDGMLKSDVSWEPVFVSFAQIRVEAEAVAELVTHLPSLAASVERSATVPETAMTFPIEAFRSWEMRWIGYIAS
ncbi:hypothetical protein PGQ11_010271 [Apiospora arundinis]|uniref:Uncharacterized protein n=1 Tax=Apiospora arundinis TaxID=335852 RepID=A0ABR2I9Q2_9PEZI